MYRVPASRKVEKPSSDGKEKKVALTWEFRYGFVLHNYLTGWFLIDLLSVTERLTLTVTLTATVTVTVTLTLTLTLTQVGPSAFDIYDLATPPAAVANATASLLELGRGDLIGSPNATALLDEAGGGGNIKVVKVLRVIRTLPALSYTPRGGRRAEPAVRCA